MSEPARGIPTVTHVDHVGVTVPDLDAGIAFFVDVLGAELLYRASPIDDPDGAFMRDHLGVHPRARLDLAALRLGPTLNLELLAFDAPGAHSAAASTADVGAAHLAFFVEDFEAALAFLRGHGVRGLGEVSAVAAGLSAGLRWVHLHTPIGLTLELVCWPSGMPYERATSARLFHPAGTHGDE